MKKSILLMSILLASVAACSPATSGSETSMPVELTPIVGTAIAEGGGTGLPPTTPDPAGTIPTLGPDVSPTGLKYRVLDQFPDLFFCDPDLYPVARQDEAALAQERFPELEANQDEFQRILVHLGLSGLTTFTDEQKLLIYREHKKLDAIDFELAGDGYQFQIQTGSEGQQGTLITARITSNGAIDVLQQEQSFPSCPICLAAGTLIDTPRGAIRVDELRVGDPVWTVDAAGVRVAALITRTGSSRVPAGHQMVHVSLHDGRELWASPGHPTADGRTFSMLKIGDTLDGGVIIALEQLPYDAATTFDVLPSGDTGYYWANGILVGSTLAR